MLLGIASARRRALASATYYNLVINLVAMGVGPLPVGISSDHLLPRYGDESLRYAIPTVFVVATLWAAIHSLLANTTLRGEDLAAADEG
jgi:hypothetical protein